MVVGVSVVEVVVVDVVDVVAVGVVVPTGRQPKALYFSHLQPVNISIGPISLKQSHFFTPEP